MKAIISQWSGEHLRDAFVVKDREVTKNIDGTETCRMTFPRELTLRANDVVHITYFPYKEQ